MAEFVPETPTQPTDSTQETQPQKVVLKLTIDIGKGMIEEL